MKKVIIIGSRGNGTVICSALKDIVHEKKEWMIAGYLNDDFGKEKKIYDMPILGSIKDINKLKKDKDCYYIYALTTVKRAKERYDLFNSLNITKEKLPTFVHPSAVISKDAKIGYGVFIMPGVVVNPGVNIGNLTQVYGNSLVGHDSNIGEFSFISNSVSIGSKIIGGIGVHYGSNCTVRENVKLGDWSICGIGSVVLKDVKSETIVVGNPAKVLK